jgi:oxaloacetate decarboxylase beta subunit
LGIGAMTDFGPLLANPVSLLLGASAQFGVFVAMVVAKVLQFSIGQAGAIGIIGGADGPTAIYTATKLAPELLGPIAVAAYTYMSLVPLIQPPIMRLLSTHEMRSTVMEQLRPVGKLERILFPIVTTFVIAILLPPVGPLVGMLMLGNLLRESGVVERLSNTAANELINICTLFLAVAVGASMNAESFLNLQTLYIIGLGVIAFGFSTAGGMLLGDLMWVMSGHKINPLIGSAGVSAVPMAARVSQKVGQKDNPANFLLMHAMGPNVAGVIGTAVAAGIMISLLGH